MRILNRIREMAIGLTRVVCLVCWLSLLLAPFGYAADFVFVCSAGDSAGEHERLKTAADFYGLNLIDVAASDSTKVSKALQQEETLGVAIAADALGVVDRTVLLRSLERGRKRPLPLLIVGVGRDTDAGLLRDWSAGGVSSVNHVTSLVDPQYLFGRVERLTAQLSGMAIPVAVQDAFVLVANEEPSVQRILSLQANNQVSPLFLKIDAQRQEIFVASTGPFLGKSAEQGDALAAFLRLAPEIMFVKVCAGDRGWHTLHHYANFTIDDPWLRQPYGYVDYKGLLEEMQRHNYHTTIAFIPWNFARSEPEVVSLFREHPDRFSIAVHGNNHDHKEFTDYQHKSLADQIADLKQALARMERFRQLTGIPYDKVMVFPHSIAPEETLGALKTYNYLATVNYSNVPQGVVKPTDDSSELRSVTMQFAGFPSFSRYPAPVPIPNGLIAVYDFLDNPLFFYAHADFFSQGNNAFDSVADKVNKVEPDTDWRSLGYIVKHFYLLRLREDLNYDVMVFSNCITLENISGSDSIFYLRKREDGAQVIRSVVIDGQTYPYRLQNGHLDLSVAIPKGASRNIAIEYQNDFELAPSNPAHGSYMVSALRWGSDFRDIYLEKSKIGLAVVRVYNDHNMKPWQVLGPLVILFVICLFGCYRRGLVFKRSPRGGNGEYHLSSIAGQGSGTSKMNH